MTKQTDALVEEVDKYIETNIPEVNSLCRYEYAYELVTLITASNLERVEKAVEPLLADKIPLVQVGMPLKKIVKEAIEQLKDK